MKQVRLILVIAAAVVLCGCGAEGNSAGLPSSAGKVPDIRGRILSEEKKAAEKKESRQVLPAAKETGKEKQQTDQKQDDNDTKETAGGQSVPQPGTAEKQDTTIKGNNERQAATASGPDGKMEEPEYRSAEVPKTKKVMEKEREKTAPGNQQATKESEASSTHTHQWEAVTKTIRHPAETEQRWIVDRKAWEETVTKEEPVYEDVLICVATCRGCGASFSSEDVDSALNQCHSHIISEHGNSCGYGTEQSYYEKRQTGTTSKKETVFHPEEGHYETVETKAAWNETVVTGYRCASCGSTR